MSTTISALRAMLKTANENVKTAQAKAAFGGVDSTHPSDKADDGNVDPKEGPRGAEHEKDLKAVPGPSNVNDAPEAKEDEQNSVQMNVGLESKTVGSDPANEDPKRMKPQDPGTSHPADAEKMAAAELHKQFDTKTNGLLAKIAAARAPAATPADKIAPEHKAAAAGYADAAAAIDAGGEDPELAKFAASVLDNYVLAAELVVDHLKKVAEEDEGGGEKKDKKDEGGGEKKSPPADGGGEGGGDGGPPLDMNSAPPDLVSQMQGGGGGPPGAGGGPPGAGGDPMADAQELLSLLAEMGMTPRDLIDQLHQAMGGMGGGAPGAGGPPPGVSGPPDMGGGPAIGAGGPPSGPGGGMDDPTAKMARYQAVLKLAEQTDRLVKAGSLAVTAPATQEAARVRGEVKSALRSMINPRRK